MGTTGKPHGTIWRTQANDRITIEIGTPRENKEKPMKTAAGRKGNSKKHLERPRVKLQGKRRGNEGTTQGRWDNIGKGKL